VRTEVLVKVNAMSFRAAALVKGGKVPLTTSLEFLELSAGGKDALEEVLEELARLQALSRKLRAESIDAETQRALTEQPEFQLLKPDAGLLVESVRDQSEPTPCLEIDADGLQPKIVKVQAALAGMDIFI